MAECLTAVLVQAALRGGEDERAVLDCARADEHVPVRFAGLPREGGWHGDEEASGFRQRAVERGKAQVVANGEPEPPPWQVGHDGVLARAEIARLAVALAAREVDVEHMDLVI